MTGDESQHRHHSHEPVRTISRTLTVDHDLDQLWMAITDIDRMPGLHPSMLSARWLHGAREAELDAEFASDHIHLDHGVWHAVSRIVLLEPRKCFVWTVDSDLAPPTVCRFDLCPEHEPFPDGRATPRTILRQTWFHETRPGFGAPIADAVADTRRCQRTP